MNELLLELYSEEIPAMEQKLSAQLLAGNISRSLRSANIECSEPRILASPCRVAIYIAELEAQKQVIKGPACSAPKEAAEKFCAKYSASHDELTVRTHEGRQYFYLERTPSAKDVREQIQNILEQAISSAHWDANMRWGEHDITWIRPLKNILCMLDAEILPARYGHLVANNKTFGHKFFSHEELLVSSFEEYQALLRKHFVIADHEERELIIKQKLEELAKANNLTLNADEELLHEVTGLVEYPNVLIGDIEEKFTQLPKELLVLCLKTHQKYFTCSTQDGKTGNKFFVVSNLPENASLKAIENVVLGNQKVLRARLSDALFVYQQDQKTFITENFERLSTVVFHNKLGSVQHKATRLEQLAKYLEPEAIALHYAARFCKCDLLSAVVGEFPELQGTISKYYKFPSDIPAEVASIIAEHYLPNNPYDLVPSGKHAVLLSLIDKIDSLVGLILAKEDFSGSKDPYGIRRYMNCISLLLTRSKLQLDIRPIISKCAKLYQEQSFLTEVTEERITEVQDLILDRLHKLLYQEFNQEVVKLYSSSAGSKPLEGNLHFAELEMESIAKAAASKEFQNLAALYKRACRLIDTKIASTAAIDSSLLNLAEEKELFAALSTFTLSKRELESQLQELSKLLEPATTFLDKVVVRDPEPKIAANRSKLLLQLLNHLDQVPYFAATC